MKKFFVLLAVAGFLSMTTVSCGEEKKETDEHDGHEHHEHS
jgi:hypothetical protein